MTKEVTPIGKRKADHITINLREDIKSGITTGLESYHFIHHALPEINLADVNPCTIFLNKQLSVPILISSMTGGTSEAERINQNLATAAQETRIAMGVGSQRIAIEQPQTARTFIIRNTAPDIPLLANLGAIQLNLGYGIDQCRQVVEMIEADALILHFNCLQEALQPDGQPQFAGLINKVEAICKKLPVPVIAKEVGWGFSEHDIDLLVNAGISAIDVAGAGGTSWSQVEMYRSDDAHRRTVAEAFRDWGIPTAEAILNVTRIAPSTSIIASGGIRSGVDIAKCIALGASLGAMAGPFLKTASKSADETINLINILKEEIILCMFATGTKELSQLRQGKLLHK